MGKAEAFYQKFISSKQEPVRLELALQGYFASDEIQEAHRNALGDYLRRRIRPAAEALIQQNELAKLQILEAQGWMNLSVMEDCLEMTIRLKKTEAFIWLLGIKAEKYGFPDRVFDL